jgi:hypothetical protein
MFRFPLSSLSKKSIWPSRTFLESGEPPSTKSMAVAPADATLDARKQQAAMM